MDTSVIFTILGCFLACISTTITLFIWATNRSEEARKETDALRRDMIDVMRSIDKEIKDFHGRLCTIEERYRSKQ